MRFLNRLRAIVVVVVKRITSQPWLVVATTSGLVVAIGLIMSIPIYADAVYHRIFLRNIAQEGAPPGYIPPFTFLFRYDGSIYGSLPWDDVLAADAYFTNEAPGALGLPSRYVVRYATTEPLGVYADSTTSFDNTVSPLIWAGFSFISGLQDHVTVVEGHFPNVTDPGSGEPVEVMIHEDMATELGAQVGETYITYIKIRSSEGFVRSVQIPVRFVGIWQAKDALDPFWFFRPSAFSERLMVPEASFVNTVGGQLEDEVYTAAWYLVMDGQDVTHGDAGQLIRRTLAVEQRAAGLLPNTTLGTSPLEALVDYRRSANLLTILLYAFSVPIMGLLLAFITLTAGLATERRRNEVAVLRSRGAMATQMIGIAALESLLLGVAALAISSPIGMAIARLMGRTRSFLEFATTVDALRVSITMSALRFGIVAVVIGVAAQVLPTLGAANHTVVSYKREQARMLRKPWWQRAWLDVLLLIPAAYGAYVLRNQGTLFAMQDTLGSAPFENPLLFLVPALGIFALTLVFLRLMPLMMSLVGWVAARTRSVGVLMASRHLARTPGFYATPLILLVLDLEPVGLHGVSGLHPRSASL